MKVQKIVEEIFEDPQTGLKFIRDVFGNIHPYINLNDEESRIVIVEMSEQVRGENQRIRRTLERLRTENNWLFSIIEQAINDGKKKTARKALDALEKTLKERKRL